MRAPTYSIEYAQQPSLHYMLRSLLSITIISVLKAAAPSIALPTTHVFATVTHRSSMSHYIIARHSKQTLEHTTTTFLSRLSRAFQLSGQSIASLLSLGLLLHSWRVNIAL